MTSRTKVRMKVSSSGTLVVLVLHVLRLQARGALIWGVCSGSTLRRSLRPSFPSEIRSRWSR